MEIKRSCNKKFSQQQINLLIELKEKTISWEETTKKFNDLAKTKITKKQCQSKYYDAVDKIYTQTDEYQNYVAEYANTDECKNYQREYEDFKQKGSSILDYEIELLNKLVEKDKATWKIVSAKFNQITNRNLSPFDCSDIFRKANLTKFTSTEEYNNRAKRYARSNEYKEFREIYNKPNNREMPTSECHFQLLTELKNKNNSDWEKISIKFNKITDSKLTIQECQNKLYQKIKQTKQKDSRAIIKKQHNNKSFTQQLNECRQSSESYNEPSAMNVVFDIPTCDDLSGSFM